MQRGLATRKLSVRLSNAWIVKKIKESSVQIFIPHERTIMIVVLPTRRTVGGGRPLLPEILGQADPVGAKTPIFNQYLLVAPQ